MNATRNSLHRVTILFLAVYWLLLFVSTHLPARELAQLPAGSDKVIHFAAYFVLGWLLMGTFRPRHRPRDAAILTLIVGAIYGAIDEGSQAFVPGRFPDRRDWMADIGGAATAAVLYAALVQTAIRARCAARHRFHPGREQNG